MGATTSRGTPTRCYRVTLVPFVPLSTAAHLHSAAISPSACSASASICSFTHVATEPARAVATTRRRDGSRGSASCSCPCRTFTSSSRSPPSCDKSYAPISARSCPCFSAPHSGPFKLCVLIRASSAARLEHSRCYTPGRARLNGTHTCTCSSQVGRSHRMGALGAQCLDEVSATSFRSRRCPSFSDADS